MKFATFSLAMFFCISTFCVGCKPSVTTDSNAKSAAVNHDPAGDEPHDHEHPETLKDAAKALAELYSKIKPAFEGGDPDAAHGELHEAAHILDEIFPDLIKKNTTLDTETKTKLESSITKLFDSFSKLDEVLHGGPEVEFGPIDTSISSTMEELNAILP